MEILILSQEHMEILLLLEILILTQEHMETIVKLLDSSLDICLLTCHYILDRLFPIEGEVGAPHLLR